MTKPVRIGVVGTGFLAETRVRCYGRVAGGRAEVIAVASRTSENAADFAARHGIRQACADVDALLAMDEVDVVDLCVPNAMHRTLAVAAAAAGKHIVCTKPLAAYVGQDLDSAASDADISGCDRRQMLSVATADARAMVVAADAAGVRLMYGENWVYAPSFTRSMGLLRASGAPVLEMRGWEGHSGSHSPYSKTWRNTGGGALLRLGAHPIGAMLYLKREEGLARDGRPIRPVSVTADVADLTRVSGQQEHNVRVATGWVDVETWGCAILTFDDDSRGVAYGSDVLLGGMESKLSIYASNCHLECNLSPGDQVRAYAPDASVFGDEYIMEKVDSGAGWSTPMPDEDWSSGQQAMCQDFVDAIAVGRPARSDGELGFDVTRVVYAAYYAAAQGRRIEL